jgi:hypothetical protein
MTDEQFRAALKEAHRAILALSINARDHTTAHFANKTGSIFGQLDALRTAIEREHDEKGK